jgi:soluble lytic murein transglycosylase-like protein
MYMSTFTERKVLAVEKLFSAKREKILSALFIFLLGATSALSFMAKLRYDEYKELDPKLVHKQDDAYYGSFYAVVFRDFNSNQKEARKMLARYLSPSKKELRRVILDASQMHGVSAGLIYGVAAGESSLNRYSVSDTGALGYMQVFCSQHPKECALAHQICGFKKKKPIDMFNTCTNIHAGALVIVKYRKEFEQNDPKTMLAYRMGNNRLREKLQKIDADTFQEFNQKFLSGEGYLERMYRHKIAFEQFKKSGYIYKVPVNGEVDRYDFVTAYLM